MTQFFSFLEKDLLIEFRSRELIYALLTLAIIIAVFFGLGAANAFVEQRALIRLFPSALWVTYIFATTASVSRGLYYEIEFGALASLICARASLAAFYLSKVLVTTLLTTLGALCIGVALSAFFEPHLAILQLISIAGLVSLGYASLAILIAMMTIKTKLRDLLLPLLLLPLLFPLFFAAHELTMEMVLNTGALISSPWLTLLVLIDLIYLLGGSLLFSHTARG